MILANILNPFTNPTQLMGLLSFATAAIACVIAARRSEPGDARIWNALGLLNAVFFAEIYAGTRYHLLGLIVGLLKADGRYDQIHGSVQGAVVILVAGIGALFAARILFSRQVGRGATRLAAGITVVVAALFAIETMSLHSLDAIFYRPIGPVLALGWMWAATAIGIILAAIQRSVRR
jgi:hypothetical protein